MKNTDAFTTVIRRDLEGLTAAEVIESALSEMRAFAEHLSTNVTGFTTHRDYLVGRAYVRSLTALLTVAKDKADEEEHKRVSAY